MKKYLTLRNVLVFSAAVLAIVAFFVAFGSGIFEIDEGDRYEYLGIVIGTLKIIDGAHTGEIPPEAAWHAGLALAGLIMALVASLGAVAVKIFFSEKKWSKWAVIGCAGVILVGAVFVCFTKDNFIVAHVDKMIEIGECKPSERAEMIAYYREEFGPMNLNACAIISIICSFLAAIGVGVSEFIKDKQLAK